MAEMSQQTEIPNRSLFKAAEVCELAKVQPYVLRSWEAEFKDLGVTRSGSTARVYRREDVERVLRIKHLLLIEGLTLAGVRRKLDAEAEPPLEDEPIVVSAHAPLAAAARERIGGVKRGLRSLLDLLDGPVQEQTATPERAAAGSSAEFALAPPGGVEAAAAHASSKRTAPTEDAGKPPSPRRKRSA
jgi:DNA-binding transcriptional MerR regulator